jgi:hypothetical protein
MKRYWIGGAIVLALAVVVFAGSHDEFTWHKVKGPGPYHVDVASGHGKMCYVFTEEYEKSNAGGTTCSAVVRAEHPAAIAHPCEKLVRS